MGYPEFGANFHKVRKTDENGNILVDQWFYNVALAGTTSTSLLGSIVTVTMQKDGAVYVKQ